MAGLLISVNTAGFCAVTGLLIIPTADTVGDGNYTGEYQKDKVISGATSDDTRLNNEYGIGDQIEAGVDYSMQGPDAYSALYNFKYTVAQSKKRAFRAAIGLMEITSREKPTVFAVISMNTSVGRLHFGSMSVEGIFCGVVGFERSIGNIVLECDYTSGGENPASAGFVYQLNPTFGIEAGMTFGSRDVEKGFTVHLVWNKNLRRNS